MALSDSELQDIIDSLSAEERKQLLSQLNRQVKVDSITNPKGVNEEERPNKKYDTDNGVYCLQGYSYLIVRKNRLYSSRSLSLLLFAS